MRNLRSINERRNGIVLIVILFIVAMISVLSFGYAIKADRELSFGENVGLRMEMDYLSRTGLNYGKSLVMNPQNVTTGSGGYWEGSSGLQMESGDDYFDVTVVQAESGDTRECTYNITSEAYRKVGGSNIAMSGMSGVLRLDPCIGYVQLNDSTIAAEVRVKGDVWCNMNLDVYGVVNGDVFAAGVINEFGTIDGQKQTGVVSSPVSLPSLSALDYRSVYYIGSQMYFVEEIDRPVYTDLTLEPSAANPAGIFYRDGNLDLQGVTNITGMLIVKNHIRIFGEATTITAVKNFPALLVAGDIWLKRSDLRLDVTGLAQVGAYISMGSSDNCEVNFTGALHMLNGRIMDTEGVGTSVTITADPMAAALKTWSSDGSVTYWMPAGGSFFRSISRD